MDKCTQPIPTDGAGHNPSATWLGVGMNYRRLFEALQDGWLRPLAASSGMLLGNRAYALEQSAAEHPICVYIKLTADKLPAVDVHIWQRETWQPSELDKLGDASGLYWPGALPTFSISEILVATEEERVRLMGLASAFSNVDLPEEVIVGDKPKELFEVNVPPSDVAAQLTIPDNEDAIHGAMSMAVWGVPHIKPWFDILTKSLAGNSSPEELHRASKEVEATWWRFPPWSLQAEATQQTNLDESLWLAAVDVFKRRGNGDSRKPYNLAEQIAEEASKRNCTGNSDAITAWLQTTHDILRAESTIQLTNQSCPVGIAIQLVLTRPEPTAFRTWYKDKPNLPPGVVWTATTLCGLLNGYKKLDYQFRGKALQREFLSIHALRMCKGAPDIKWQLYPVDALHWRKDSNAFILSWGGKEVLRKPEKSREKWSEADFENTLVMQQALAEAQKLGWPCIDKEIIVTDRQILLSGSGDVTKRGRTLDIQGEVRLKVPKDSAINDTLDIESFLHLVTTAGGVLGDYPIARTASAQIERKDVSEVPGLVYAQNFISEDEEQKLVEIIDSGEWRTDLKRRVQHYGWRYDYAARQIDPSMKIGPLPEWVRDLAERLLREKLVPQLPDQVIVNEYKESQGISKHIDSEKSFADGIATISLLESWEMWFQRHGKDRHELKLENRSVAIMNNDARYLWTHEIRKRKNEFKKPRVRRISLTFRKVNDKVNDLENS